jgi:hypothetical protein
MPPEMGRLGLQIATWIVLVAAVLLPFLDKGSAEYIITQFSLVLGVLFGIVILLLLWGSRDRTGSGRNQ